jgi:hypothetical protein
MGGMDAVVTVQQVDGPQLDEVIRFLGRRRRGGMEPNYLVVGFVGYGVCIVDDRFQGEYRINRYKYIQYR